MTNEIDKNFLNNFRQCGEPFAVINSRIYTLSRPKGHYRNALHIMDKAYPLDESEEVFRLENSLFLRHARGIESVMSDYIKRNFSDKFESSRAEVMSMNNFYESMQDGSIETFIRVDVFNAYNLSSREIETGKVSIDLPNWNVRATQPSINDLVSKDDSLGSLAKRPGFLSMANRCYLLLNNGTQDGSRDYVSFEGSILGIKPWMRLEELCEQYTSAISERIQKKAGEHAQVFGKALEEIAEKKRQISNAVNSFNAGSVQGDRWGEIGFRKIRENEYQVSLDIMPYIIEKQDRYFFFDGVKIGIVITAVNNGIMIDGPPKVLNMPYRHPFVHDGGIMCWGEFKWETKLHFNQFYELSHRKAVAKMVAYVLLKGKLNLESGHVGRPISELGDLGCQIADNRAAAERHALSRGIPKGRIIDND
ncbi:hypothetical protein HY638_05395 [Candidatus Woesearchaeota archaeon]|nr:hypothetical protein [Candidatus Woesearchaeota archaeon]